VTPRRLLARLRTPVVAPMLGRRGFAAALGVVGAIQVAAGVWQFQTFRCPMLHAIGIPCPGCGASRACGALLYGDWDQAARLHLFAPLFLLAAALFALGAVLPDRPRDALVGAVGRVEGRTALTSLLLAALIVYWLARLLYAPLAFIRLVSE
jgi:hypothetical protein